MPIVLNDPAEIFDRGGTLQSAWYDTASLLHAHMTNVRRKTVTMLQAISLLPEVLLLQW
jgi:hypothetical protein